MSTPKKKEPRSELMKIYMNEAFDIGFYDYFKDIKNNKISQVLNKRERKVNLSTVTYRQLNSWEEHDLLTIDRENREWRKFSLMDAIWVRIVRDLREFGYPLEKIKTAKESLSLYSEKCKVSMPLLEFFTAFAIGKKMPVVVLFFSDGVAVPASFTQYKVTKEIFDVENHIHVNLNGILQGFFPHIDMKPKYELEVPVSIEEVELLAFMRVKTFEKIEVHYRNGRMDTLEGLERVSVKNRISDILREQKYSRIELIQEDGKVTSIVRKIKKRIGK